MGILDDLLEDQNKQKKTNVGILDDLLETPKTPSQEARIENQPIVSFRDNPKATIDSKSPVDSFKDPVDSFFGGKKPETPAQVTQEEMVRQYDGKMVPKSQAKNSYGGLIYGQELGQSDGSTAVKLPDGISDVPRFTLDAIKKRAEQAGNTIDNIKYNQKISANPMETNIIRDIGRNTKRSEDRVLSTQEGENSKKDMAQWEQSFIKNNPVIGEFYKSGKQFIMRDLPRSLAGAVESQASSIDTPVMEDIANWAGSMSDHFLKTKVQNYQENAPDDLSSFTEGGWKDGRFYARGIGQVIPQFLTAIGLAVATKKPSVGLAFGFEQEAGQAYNDLVDRGVSSSDARIGANVYGMVATLLEGVNFTKYADKLIGKSVATEVKQSWKQAVRETLKEGGVDMLKEGATEGAQQFAQNVMTKFYDKNQDLFEGVIDSSVIGALGGAGYASIGLGQNSQIPESAKQIYSDLRSNISKARDIVRGKLSPKTQDEAIVAERVVAQYENKVKETAITLYDPNMQKPFSQSQETDRIDPIVKIETVKYDDGTFAASAEVNIEGNVTITPFEETYATKEEAIKASMEGIKNIVDDPIIKTELNRPIEELQNTMPWDAEQAIGINTSYIEQKKGEILREYESGYKNEVSYTEFVQDKLKTINESYEASIWEIGQEIANSEAGYRNFSYNEDAPGSTVTAVSSTFPKWIPEDLRDKKLMEKTFAMFTESTIIPPRNTRMRKLADVYLKHLDPNLFVYEGESGQQLQGPAVGKKLGKSPEVGIDKNNGGNKGDEKSGSTPKDDATITETRDRKESSGGGDAKSEKRKSVEITDEMTGYKKTPMDSRTIEKLSNVEKYIEDIANINSGYIAKYGMEKLREEAMIKYVKEVKRYISKGFDVPQSIIDTNPEFKKGLDARARYEKGLYTSFSNKDIRIDESTKEKIGGGVKRQDGKEITPEQKKEIVDGVTKTSKALGIDIKRFAEGENLVFVHLNGKNPFLMSGAKISGLYRKSGDQISVSVGGTETAIDSVRGERVTEKIHTTMAHEIGHALDYMIDGGITREFMGIPGNAMYNPVTTLRKYFRKPEERTARMIEQYVALKDGDTSYYSKPAYWSKEIFDKMIPEIERVINMKFGEYKFDINAPDSVKEIQKDRANSFASFVESPGVAGFEKRGGEQGEKFKLSERIKSIIQDLDTHYTRYVSPDSRGTFYTQTGNIAIRSLNDIDTVHHELSHLIDIKQGITDGYKDNQEIIDRLTDIYQTYYPGAKSTDDLDTRLKEGYAVLQQKYLSNPTIILRDYQDLVDEFITNGDSLQKKLNEDMQKLISDYQGLSDMDKIGAVTSDNIHNKEADSFLNTLEKIEAYGVDAVLPFVKLEEQAQNKTGVDSLLYASKSINGRIYKNIGERKMGFWHFKDGNLQKLYDYNWASLIHEIGQKNQLDNFANWLIARDQVGQYERLGRMNAKLQNMEEGDEKTKLEQRRNEVYQYLQSNGQILDRKVMERVNKEFAPAFKEYADKFDALLKADINFLHDSGILSDDHFEAIMKTEGYAPIRRLLDDGIIGEAKTDTTIGGVKIGKATQIKTREGGTMDILNPVLGALQNHMEAMQKGYKQMTVNKVYDLLQEFPGLGQAFQPTVREINGKETFTTPDGKPLSMDANIIMKMVKGKPMPMAVNENLINTLEGVFNPKKRGGLEKIVTGATQLFTKGTTGVYVPFFLTNLIRDQFTAIIHSKNGYIPVIDQFRELLPAVMNRSGVEMQYIREYLSLGGHQNRLKWNEATGQEILEDLQGREKGWKKWLGYVNAGVDILAIPANISETGTRIVEYVKSRKSGKNMWQSLEDAGQLTAPFHHQGLAMNSEYGRGYMRSMPFFNATLQGLSQYIRTARSTEGKKNIAKVYISATLMMVGGTIAIWSMGDDEDKKALIDIQPEMFSLYVFLPKGNGELYKIPIPHELGGIGGMIGMTINDFMGNAKYSPKEYFDTSTVWIPEQFNFTDPERMALSMIPQLIKPTIEIAFNKKSFPKVGDLESKTMQRLPSEFRFNRGTSPVAKWVGSTEIAKKMGVSPIQIDHFISGQFGRATGYATGKDTALNPLKSLLQQNYFTSGRMVEKFYNEKEWVDNKLTASSKGLTTLSDDEILKLKAKKRELGDIQELITDYSALDIKTEDISTLNEKRGKAWDALNTYFDTEVEVTAVDRLKYEKSKAKDEWAIKKEDMMSRYIEEYTQSSENFKGTKIEKKIREEMGGPKMDQTDKRRYTDFVKDFRVMRDYKDDIDVQNIYSASTNDEKLILFGELKGRIGVDSYNAKKKELKQKGIISDQLWKELQIQDRK